MLVNGSTRVAQRADLLRGRWPSPFRAAFFRVAFFRVAFLRVAFLRVAFLRVAFLRVAFLRVALCRRRLTNSMDAPIVHHMVNYPRQQPALDKVFATLADPTRRAILSRLAQAESLSVSELARPFDIKLPAVMKHLDVLGDAGLITRKKRGRTVDVRLSARPLRRASEWLRDYERFWSSALDRLVAHAEHKEAEARAAKPRRKSR
jgi:DNA-binding transcriptional ArsR family regulator